jgi:hypothetical protein
MSNRTGKPYEKLAQAVFQAIHNQSEIHNIDVRHNVKLKGKYAGFHQVDVYWKFEVAGIERETIVQAKDWNKPVDQGELFKLKCVLDDLPGRPIGIVVTRSGYQKGARDFAIAHKIPIYELREEDYPPPLKMSNMGWARYYIVRAPLRGTIVTNEEIANEETIPKVFPITIVYDVFTPDFSNLHFHESTSWLQSEYPTTNANELRELNIPSRLFHEINLYNEERTVVGNLATTLKQIALDMDIEGIQQKLVTHAFQLPTFVKTDSLLIPYIKIDTFSADVKIERRQEVRRARMSNLAPWVLRQLNSGKTDWFAATSSVTSLLPRKKGRKTASRTRS